MTGCVNRQNTLATTTTDSTAAICAMRLRLVLFAKNFSTIDFFFMSIVFRLS